ncbi:MAG: BON domain-containing protein [Acidimicrobiia bacterium]|nr:BON domain-containing protein [Acidimicrobiia bacterium]
MHRTALRCGRVVALGLMLWLSSIAAPAVSSAQSVAAKQTSVLVGRALERLPCFGVFDFLAYSVERGTVTLQGSVYNGATKTGAEMAVKRISGVDEVRNEIEVLPASQNDDRIRWEAFFRIYTDDFLSRYAAGGPMGVQYALRDFAQYPGMQPIGIYPIHIIVKNGRMTLVGAVGNDSDKAIAFARAREVIGTFEVKNELVVARKSSQ